MSKNLSLLLRQNQGRGGDCRLAIDQAPDPLKL
jgi:hypothetical protein